MPSFLTRLKRHGGTTHWVCVSTLTITSSVGCRNMYILRTESIAVFFFFYVFFITNNQYSHINDNIDTVLPLQEMLFRSLNNGKYRTRIETKLLLSNSKQLWAFKNGKKKYLKKNLQKIRLNPRRSKKDPQRYIVLATAYNLTNGCLKKDEPLRTIRQKSFSFMFSSLGVVVTKRSHEGTTKKKERRESNKNKTKTEDVTYFLFTGAIYTAPESTITLSTFFTLRSRRPSTLASPDASHKKACEKSTQGEMREREGDPTRRVLDFSSKGGRC